MIQLTGANRNDSQQALTLVDAIPTLQGERGRPRHRPDCVFGDRGYDAEAIRQGLRGRHIIPFLAKRNTEHGSGLGAMALDSRADFRVAESVPPTARPLRETGRHSRAIPVPGMRCDLLALLGSELENGLVIHPWPPEAQGSGEFRRWRGKLF